MIFPFFKHSDYIVKLVFRIVKENGAEVEKFYFYGEDISEIKAQEDKNRQLLEISQNDGFTGLYNKTAAENAIQKCIYENAKIMVDVDYFKHFNDKYGHIVGNEVLYQVKKYGRNDFCIEE